MALGLSPFDAVRVTWLEPAAVGVPDKVAVPLPLSIKLEPGGQGARLVDQWRRVAGRGYDDDAGLAHREIRRRNGAEACGAVAGLTVIARGSVAVLPEVLVAYTSTLYVPCEPGAGLPDMAPVPLPLSVKLRLSLAAVLGACHRV